jgi:hypothetical protein
MMSEATKDAGVTSFTEAVRRYSSLLNAQSRDMREVFFRKHELRILLRVCVTIEGVKEGKKTERRCENERKNM